MVKLIKNKIYFKMIVFKFKSGGVVEWIPCSHVAHIYRGPRTESQHPPGANPMQSHIVCKSIVFNSQ